MNSLSQVRNNFDAVASVYASHAKMQAEVGQRLLQRLQYFKLQPECVLDLGCGPGLGISVLQHHFAKACIIGVDCSHAMLQQAQSQVHWWQKKPKLIQADAACLPFADKTVDCIVAQQLLPWLPDIQVFFKECFRVLKPEGLLLFTTLGPDTFKEFATPNPSFLDMHDIGDALLQQGFSDPVMDREDLVLNYRSHAALMTALAAQGERQLLNTATTSVTYELVYGQAWRGQDRQRRDVQTISLEKLRQSIPSKTS